ncbi:MAG TPA: FAD-containing oxidoreductase [Hyphomicrobium sp.]|nr:FAD-containing oxidoreductase [Hyphomicrobium sp.]
MTEHYDAAIIGTGQAGPSLANRLSQAGWKVAVIERGRFGGTCVNTGCMPTKTLVASAYAARLAARAAEYGVVIDGRVGIDMAKVKARKDAVTGTATRNIEMWLRSMPGVTVYQGQARLTSAHEIAVGTQRLRADRIFINVGGRAVIPGIPGLEDVPYLTNESIMEIEFVPEHLIVLGGSYIGLEFAQIFRRFGSRVTVIEAAPRLVPREDEDVSAAIKDILEREHIMIALETKCTSVERTGAGIRLTVDAPSGPAEITGSHLLLAIGRRPNTDQLGLDAAGVEVDRNGFIVTDDMLRTSAPSIWALGDCNGRGAFTHTAYNDFEIVAANLLDGDPRRASDRILTYGLFIDPPLGRVGMTEREARGTGRPLLVATRPMTRVGRAVEKGETLGFMKIAVDAETHKILGAAILGTSGDEAVQCITATMAAGAPYTALQRTVLIHPTVSELIPTLLGSLEPLPADKPRL